jgi:hypothetical protein
MACFVVPATEAVITTVATKVIEKKEIAALPEDKTLQKKEKSGFSHKLRWLSNLLWGGSGLLAFEHVWHGEVVPWFPFLTAAEDPADAAEMLHEMSTVGVSMAVLVTAIWAVMLGVSKVIESRPEPQTEA